MHPVLMRSAARLAFVVALASAGAHAQQRDTPERFGAWQLASGRHQGEMVLWSRAQGTVASPDVCRWFAVDGLPEPIPPAEAAAIRAARSACLILSCMPEHDRRPPRYEAILVLFGATGPAYDKLPGGAPRLDAQVRLRLDDGQLPLSVGLIEPIHVQRLQKGNLSLVPFRAAPIERAALERVLKSRSAAALPVNQFFAAYVWVIPFTSGAYAFDLSGGAAALARLDERCR